MLFVFLIQLFKSAFTKRDSDVHPDKGNVLLLLSITVTVMVAS